MDRKELLANINTAECALDAAKELLWRWDSSAENNVFQSMAEAEGVIEDTLLDVARNDCEGAGNCGLETYSREFMVGGKKYIGVLTVEYNRHDKTYYHIEDCSFSVKAL